MWQIYAMQAVELARERQREADAVRLARTAAAGHLGTGHRPVGAPVGGVGRRLVIGALRLVGSGAESLSAAACAAAARLDRGAA